MENGICKDRIKEQRFHRNIIGANGEKISEIRDKFNQGFVMFRSFVVLFLCTFAVSFGGPTESRKAELCGAPVETSKLSVARREKTMTRRKTSMNGGAKADTR
ncbi:hypothetical protein NPIL_466961 [Nephila pilipes]|uniref:Uncharacterized protein n=1 Tax=Nephila pilipes TaxID=299642 RepID=A0A8X6N6S6_NEPPI|nr:hypothetical protein NPIL_477031 [Nephila pilipes]GFS96410.1 hypothetical protein NPIL_466961 [Nephila pilipes]